MSDFAAWLFGLVKDLLIAIWDLLTDLFISVLDLVLGALLALLSALPLPSFLTSGLQTAFNGIGPDVWFFASHLRFSECFAVLSAAVVFRLARKAVTLFQW